MKNLNSILALFTLLFLFASCDKEETLEIKSSGKSVTYDLGSKAVSTISGTATFTENSDTTTTISLDIQGTPSGGLHPAHIHLNTAAEGGGIALSLTPVNGTTGKSEITVSALDDGTVVSYDDLIAFDGYINVHLSATELSTIVAQGDIGQNDLTGMTKTYDLGAKAVADISGNVTFAERINGEALAIISLSNTPDGGSHPAHIHANTAAEGGGILVSFTPVNGDTGMSETNLSALDSGSAFGYSDIEGLDAYINVHLSATELSTIVAQGDIGQNDLTGESKAYILASKDVAIISGTATFFKRVDGSALAILDIQNTPADGVHPAHIHKNDAATGGGIAVTFTPVDGNLGMSATQIEKLDDETAFTYDDILTYNGYINVHLSVAELSTIVAQGNIGSNVN
ncbi:CHRD domain-containing protein [uncultured Polaribacter sp.]|uniref:CHRD domain-containing protein n=1 Tax=uncultured Polaribacter sp. TaxID=174711 RepID=UPI002621614C|nr:CHRD domain-containing protein [uncultured Polaribacter sp.]